MIDRISHISPNLMPDEYSKSVVTVLLNVIENQQQQIIELKEQVQILKDEISKLKGEQGKPKFSTKPQNKDISSEKESKINKEHKKTSKKPFIEIDQEILCQLDRDNLPQDIIFKGYESVIQQDIIFERKNTLFKVEIWWSPSQNKTYRAKASQYEGYFGNTLKSFLLVMHHYADVTRSKLLGILQCLKIVISAGSLQNILTEHKDTFLREKRELLKTGLNYTYTQTDVTGALVAGEMWRTHIICSDQFITYSTIQGKSRRHVLFAMQGEPESGLMLSYNEVTLQYLEHFKTSKTYKQQLAEIFAGQEAISELEFCEKVKRQMPDLASKPTTFNWVCDAFAFGYYHKQTDYPQVNVLISDDAPEYKLIGKRHQLCWVHDGRYYNKLTPFVDHHKEVLDEFKGTYWQFYRSLLDYKASPQEEIKVQIEQNFDKLYVPDKSYFDLNKVIERTYGDKNELLTVLEFPQIPLHNNQSELSARQQTRKRDICLHTMTRLGTALQDAYMSIIHTCKLQGINPFSYILDRISGKNTYYLPDIVAYAINSS